MIKDSGNRTEFESGFVRDIQEGKGRMDLPLSICQSTVKRVPRNMANTTSTRARQCTAF